MKIDVIVCWPRSCDYPLWRQFIRDNRDKFNEVIISFTETNQGEDYREFVKKAMVEDHCIFIDIAPVPSGEDWRDVAINNALLYSYNADWVWFTEQDFYIKGDDFWTQFHTAVDNGSEVVGVMDGERLHPCSLFISKAALEKTNKEFGIVPDKSDHFYIMQKDIQALGLPTAILDNDSYYHMAGLSHNMYLASLNKAPNYERKIFVSWLKDCLTVSVDLHPTFVELAQQTIDLYDGKRTKVQPLTDTF